MNCFDYKENGTPLQLLQMVSIKYSVTDRSGQRLLSVSTRHNKYLAEFPFCQKNIQKNFKKMSYFLHHIEMLRFLSISIFAIFNLWMHSFISTEILLNSSKLYAIFLMYFSAYCMYHKILAIVFWWSIRHAYDGLFDHFQTFLWFIFWTFDAVFEIYRKLFNIRLQKITVVFNNYRHGLLLVATNVHTQRIMEMSYSLPIFDF